VIARLIAHVMQSWSMGFARGHDLVRLFLIGAASLSALACGPGQPAASNGETGPSQTDTGDTGDGDPGDGHGDPDDDDPGDGDPGDGHGDGDPGDGDGDPGDGNPDSGALLWQDVFTVFQHADQAWGVAVDSNDQIFVAGLAFVADLDSDAWYRKYSPGGQLFWQQTFGGPGQNSSVDMCFRVAIDPNDNLIMACSIDNGVDHDALLGKYDQNGAEIWTQQFDFGDDRAIAVAADSDGTIVVSGTGGGDGYLRRYDADGGLIWHRTYHFDYFGNDTRGWDVGYTADGNIAVAIEPGPRARLYTTAGDELWTYEGVAGEAIGLGIDGNDVLLAGGDMFEPDAGWLGRLDAAGDSMWEQTWTGDTYAYANDIAVDSTGRIVAVGHRQVLDQGVLATTRKYSADGQTLIWEQTLQGSVIIGSNGAVSVAIDSQDNVIVCGWLDQDTGIDQPDLDAFVAKYAP
jgi:hypothetical protein